MKPTAFRGKQFGSFPGRDNQRDLFLLLERLGHGVPEWIGNARRKQFLAWCCARVGQGVQVAPKTVGLTREVYHDVVALSAQFDLDLEAAAMHLQSIVRKQR